MIYNDKEIWDKVKKNDKKTFELIFNKFYNSLCLYSFGVVKDEEVSKEIVADVFLKLWQKRQQIEFIHGLKPYLFRSVLNASLDHLDTVKKNNQYQKVEITDKIKELVAYDGENIIDKLFLDDVEKDVEQAINNLAPQCKEIFCLSRFYQLTYEEISTKLNISINTVKTQMCRALESLREQLGRYL